MAFRRLRITCLVLYLVASQTCMADTAARYLTIAAGHVGVLDQDIDDPGVFKLEYRFRPATRWSLAPAVGAAKSANGASFIFTDLEKDFLPTDHLVITPSFGLGSFDDGRDVRLGHTLEFRTGIKIAYQFNNKWRAGIALFHLSNGGLGDRNPGTEPMFLSISVPL